jgi:hypothetical protein
MRRRIKLTTRRELTAAIRQRYQAADRNSKKITLERFPSRYIPTYQTVMASEVEPPFVPYCCKTKGGSTPLRSGRHDIPWGNFGYINPGIALDEFIKVTGRGDGTPWLSSRREKGCETVPIATVALHIQKS